MENKRVIKNSRDFIIYRSEKYKETFGEPYIPNYSREGAMLKSKLLKLFDSDKLIAIIDTCMHYYPVKWATKQYPRPTIGALCSWLGNRCVALIDQQPQTRSQTTEKYNVTENNKSFFNLLDSID